MRPIYIIMAGTAVLSMAAPPTAQWGPERTYSQQLRVQIDAGVTNGTISRRESVDLREDLGRLVQLERRYSRNGISGREYSVLMKRSAALEHARAGLRPLGGVANRGVVDQLALFPLHDRIGALGNRRPGHHANRRARPHRLARLAARCN